MPNITSPSILQVRNAADVLVVPAARSLQFIGGIVVTGVVNGKAVIDGTTVSGNAWDVLGNAGGGLVLGTTTANAWDLIVNALVSAGFEADGRLFVSNPGVKKHVLALDTEPNGGAGQAANLGSIGLVNNGGTVSAWLKTGALDTSWTQLVTSAMLGWSLSGNILTGGSPATPNEFFGSLNDYDVPIQRNSIEIMRLLGDGVNEGLVIGDTTFAPGTSIAKLQLNTQVNGRVLSREVFDQSGAFVTDATRNSRTQTIGAVSANVDIPTFTNSTMLWRVYCSVKQTAGGTGAVGDSANFALLLAVNNVGGIVTIFDTQTLMSYAVDAGITFVASASGTNIRFACTGVAGRTLKWGIRTEVLFA